jgi:hypothetical protein
MSNTPTTSDELLRRARGGDQEALARLFDHLPVASGRDLPRASPKIAPGG